MEMDKFRLKANWLQKLAVFEGRHTGASPNLSAFLGHSTPLKTCP